MIYTIMAYIIIIGLSLMIIWHYNNFLKESEIQIYANDVFGINLKDI